MRIPMETFFHFIFWDHEISIIVTSILTVLTVFRRKLSLSYHGNSFVEVTIHICMVFDYDLLCDLLEILNFNKYRSAQLNLGDQFDWSNCHHT
jgi:hypothetical protein